MQLLINTSVAEVKQKSTIPFYKSPKLTTVQFTMSYTWIWPACQLHWDWSNKLALVPFPVLLCVYATAVYKLKELDSDIFD